MKNLKNKLGDDQGLDYLELSQGDDQGLDFLG